MQASGQNKRVLVLQTSQRIGQADGMMEKRDHHMPHNLFTQRLCSMLTLVPRFTIDQPILQILKVWYTKVNWSEHRSGLREQRAGRQCHTRRSRAGKVGDTIKARPGSVKSFKFNFFLIPTAFPVSAGRQFRLHHGKQPFDIQNLFFSY